MQPDRVLKDGRGEFNNGYLYLTGVTQRYGGRYSLSQDLSTAGVKQFALASVDTTRDWFFSSLIPLIDDGVQIGPAPDDVMRSPLWSYQFGLQSSFMPIFPRFRRRPCGPRLWNPIDSGLSAW
ncbi:hypothetical protein K438DRAFT_594904 [Mycena galopus ATCC 62051]|nr:hypothetical protein K438DRAFT_594904 [Mycena galopus ATCC 62051]